jgi:hypothetical protein
MITLLSLYFPQQRAGCYLVIEKVEFTHCSRDVNMVAHEIARSWLISKISCNWVDELPSFILDRIVNDLIVQSSKFQTHSFSYEGT